MATDKAPDGMITVKPARGRLVRDYRTKLPIPREGLSVPAADPYFAQALSFGDLVEAEPAAPDDAGKPAAKPAK